ncbi:hypothetical protein SCARD494_10125 [Seiridium cardinale]
MSTRNSRAGSHSSRDDLEHIVARNKTLNHLEGKSTILEPNDLKSVGITPKDLYQMEDVPDRASALQRLERTRSSKSTLFSTSRGSSSQNFAANPRLSRALSTQSRRSSSQCAAEPTRPRISPLQTKMSPRIDSARDTLMPLNRMSVDDLPPPLSPALTTGSIVPKRSATNRFAQTATSGFKHIQTAASLKVNTLKEIHQRRLERAEHLEQTPHCPVHGSQYCAEHLYWIVGTDPAIRHGTDAALAVDVLTSDNARFDYRSDQLRHLDKVERSFNYVDPQSHWFVYCRQCGLTFLKGSAGDSIKTHPSHLSSSSGFGERAITAWVDGCYIEGTAVWTSFFGPNSPYNVNCKSPAVRRDELEFYALSACLNSVRDDIWNARRETVKGVMYPKHDPRKVKVNSQAFELSAQRFTLVVFSPIKSFLALCSDEDGQVLELHQKAGVFRYMVDAVVENDQNHWLKKRRESDFWTKEMGRAQDSICALAEIGVQVLFCYTPREGEFRTEWTPMATAGSTRWRSGTDCDKTFRYL